MLRWTVVRVICVVLIGQVMSSSITLNQEALESVCVYNTFDCRNRTIPGLPVGYSSCCQECVCSEDCVNGNCCPNSAIDRSMLASCRSQTSLFGEHEHMGRIISNFAFYTVDSCPDHSNETLKSACENPKDVQYFNLVSDPRNNNIFKNEKCALCNGVASIQRWTQGFLIGNSANITDIVRLVYENDIQQIQKIAQIYSVPPRGFPSDLYICSAQPISKCNVTGAWKQYNETLADLCEHTVFTPEYRQFTQAFKNIYCAMCNVKSPNKLRGMCPDIEKLTFIKGRTYTLSVLFRSEELNTDIQVHYNIHCGKDEVHDPFTEQCVELRCPVGKFAHYGQCQNNPYSTDGLSISAIFELSMTRDIEKSQFTLAVTSQLIDSIGLTRLGCSLCFYTLFEVIDNSKTRYFLRLASLTGYSCSEEVILTKFRKLLYAKDGLISLRLSEDVVVSIRFKLIEKEYFDQLENVTLIRSNLYTGCDEGVPLGNLFFCPSVRFNTTNIKRYYQSEKLLEALMGVSEIIQWPTSNTEIYTVCLAVYRRLAEEANMSTVKLSQAMTQMNYTSCSILACLSLITVVMIVQHRDVLLVMKVVVATVCMCINLGRIIDVLLYELVLFDEKSSLILRQSVASFCCLFVSSIQLGILTVSTKLIDCPDALYSLRPHIRYIMVVSFSTATTLATCEGVYLWNRFVESNDLQSILSHSIICFLPSAICLGISIPFVYKQLSTNINDECKYIVHTITLSRGLFIISTFSFLFEIIRSIKEISFNPAFPLMEHILSVLLGILILVCCTVQVKHIVINCVLQTIVRFRTKE